MRIRLPKRPAFLRSYEWHRWFAWHPVVIDGVVVWMEMLERCVTSCEAGSIHDYRFPTTPTRGSDE